MYVFMTVFALGKLTDRSVLKILLYPYALVAGIRNLIPYENSH